jgi:hypothetical protein
VRDQPGQCIVGDGDIFPDNRKNLVLFDDAGGALEKEAKKVNALGLEWECLTVFAEFECSRIELVMPELKSRVGGVHQL